MVKQRTLLLYPMAQSQVRLYRVEHECMLYNCYVMYQVEKFKLLLYQIDV